MAAAVLLVTSPTLFSEELIGDFRLGWKPGAIYDQTIDVYQKVSIPLRGTAEATTTLGLELKPTAAKSGRSLGMKLSTFKTLVDMPPPSGNEEWDSAAPQKGNQDIAKFHAAFQALPIRASMDARGQVTALNGLEGLKLDNPLTERFLGKETLAALLRQGWFLSLPAKSVRIGESWPYQLSFPTPLGALKMQGNYTLEGSETRTGIPCWRLLVNGSMTAAPAPSKENAKPAASEEEQELREKIAKLGLTVKSSTMNGYLWFNPAEQLIHESEITTKVNLGLASKPGETNTKPTAEIPIVQKLKLQLRRRP